MTIEQVLNQNKHTDPLIRVRDCIRLLEVSDACKNLLTLMLNRHACLRPAARDCLNHQWFTGLANPNPQQ